VYSWTLKPRKQVQEITFKIYVSLEFLAQEDKYKIELEPTAKVVKKSSEKSINTGIISISVEGLKKGQEYNLRIRQT
jgi:hypothetical protein